MDMCWVLIGPPGAGKGTQGVRLAEVLAARYFSVGHLLRDESTASSEEGRQLRAIIDVGEVVPTDLLMPVLEKAMADLSDTQSVIIDFAVTSEQCVLLDKMLAQYGRTIGAVFMLDVPYDELRMRLLTRGRPDDTPDLIERRFAIYKREIAPVLKYYEEKDLLRVVDGSGPLEVVTSRLQDRLASIQSRGAK
jgi:adenylate kinase